MAIGNARLFHQCCLSLFVPTADRPSKSSAGKYCKGRFGGLERRKTFGQEEKRIPLSSPSVRFLSNHVQLLILGPSPYRRRSSANQRNLPPTKEVIRWDIQVNLGPDVSLRLRWHGTEVIRLDRPFELSSHEVGQSSYRYVG